MRTMLLCVLLVGGCGAAPAAAFAGKWNGTISEGPTDCSDGTTAPPSTTTITVDLAQTGDNTLTWHSDCGDTAVEVVSSVEAAAVTLKCPTTTQSGVQITPTLSGGDFVLFNNALDVRYEVDSDFSTSTKSGTCSTRASGTLARQ